MEAAPPGPGRGRGRGRGRANVKTEADASSPAGAAAPSRKFVPNVNAPRRKTVVKSEAVETDSSEVEKLIQQAQEAAARRGFRHADNKAIATQVAFGSGSGAISRPTSLHKRSSGSSRKVSAKAKSYRGPVKKEAAGIVADSGGDAMLVDEKPSKEISAFEEAENPPISLPLRRPVGVGTAYSDDESDNENTPPFDEENAAPPAKELGLEAPDAEDRLLFLQLPSILPSGSGQVGPGASLDKFPEGLMGKLRIYESGAMKLQVGEVLMNVHPGTRCVFSQEVVAINSSTKICAFLGDVGQRLVVTPDLDRLLGDDV